MNFNCKKYRKINDENKTYLSNVNNVIFNEKSKYVE